MKSELNRKDVVLPDVTYPYLGHSVKFRLTILFTGPRKGVVVHTGDGSISGGNVGEYQENWSEAAYERLVGSVTLSND